MPPGARGRSRVAIVTNAWLRGGGAEQALFTLVSSLDRERVDLTVFTLFTRRSGMQFAEAVEGLGVHVSRVYMTPRRGAAFLREGWRFSRELRAGRFDAVHGSGDRCIGVALGRLVGIPVRIQTIHDAFVRPRSLDYWLRLFALHAFATRVAVVSEAVAVRLSRSYRIPPDRIEVIVNGVDSKALLNEADRPDVFVRGRDTPARVLTVARLVPEKGLDLLLDAISIVAREIPGVQLYIAGDGRLRTELTEQARRLGIEERVTFAGLVTGLKDAMLSSRIFALISRSEGLGLAAIEAMAAGLPVVASKAGGLSEVVVDGVTGLLVGVPASEGPSSTSDVAQAIRHLLEDQPLARDMGAAGRKRFEDLFTAAQFARKYEELYEGTR